MTSSTITVSTTQELYSALAKCKGGETILLEGGDYESLKLSAKSGFNIDFPSTVTIASADPSDPAVFSQASVTGVSNLAIEGVIFDYTYKSGDPVWSQPFIFTKCDGLTIRNSTFDGDVASGTGSPTADGYGNAKALSVSGSKDVLIEGNEIYGFHRGLVAGECEGVVVRGNELYGMRSDGMDFAELNGVLIEDNYIHDFKASPTSSDHPDMIQFWTNGTDEPTKDVVIRNNVLDIGNGTPTQSIFMRNDLVDRGLASFEAMAYRNVLIENNTITNAHKWGISVGEAKGLTIRENTVVHADGRNADGADSSVEIPLINVAKSSTGVTVAENVTSAISGWTSQPDWTVRNNAFVQDQNPNAPGYYADVFVGSSLQPGRDGSHNFLALPGAMIDKLGAGSQATQPSDKGLQVLFHMEEADSATRVFDAGSSTLNGSSLPRGTTYLWDFGDGTTGKGQEVSHSYADGGDYKATLTVVLPNGTKATQATQIDVQGPEVLTMDASGRFTAYENGDPIALGVASKAVAADGLQLGAVGASASVARAHVLDVVGADDVTIAFTLDADKAGASGELFRLHGSFIVGVTATGELNVQIMRDGASPVSLTTKGAGLNSIVNDESDVVINLDDGQLQVWVDDRLSGQVAVPGVVGGATGFGSHGLVFGNPWGKANFNGDLSGFELSVGASDFPDKPQTTTVSSSAIELDRVVTLIATTEPAALADLSPESAASDAWSDDVRGALDRFATLLQDRMDHHVA